MGSNTQNVLQVFTFTKEGPGGDLVKSAEIVSPCLFNYCTVHVLAPCLMVFYPKTAVQVCLRYTNICQKDILLCISAKNYHNVISCTVQLDHNQKMTDR